MTRNILDLIVHCQYPLTTITWSDDDCNFLSWFRDSLEWYRIFMIIIFRCVFQRKPLVELQMRKTNKPIRSSHSASSSISYAMTPSMAGEIDDDNRKGKNGMKWVSLVEYPLVVIWTTIFDLTSHLNSLTLTCFDRHSMTVVGAEHAEIQLKYEENCPFYQIIEFRWQTKKKDDVTHHEWRWTVQN